MSKRGHLPTMRKNSGQHLPAVACTYHPDALLIEDYHAGDLICPECGLVVGDRVIDIGSEWRTFKNETGTKDNSRVGAAENPMFQGRDISTSIALSPDSPRDEHGRHIYKSRRKATGREVALFQGTRDIGEMSDKLHLPKVAVERAKTLFNKVNEIKNMRSNDAIAPACLYIACRQEGADRSFKEICSVSTASKKDLSKMFKLVMEKTGTNLDRTSSETYLSRFCTNLDLPHSVQEAAKCIAKRAEEMELVTGRSPLSVAGAAIYMASQASSDKKAREEIAAITGVHEETITKCYKSILPKATELFPQDFKFTTDLESLSRD